MSLVRRIILSMTLIISLSSTSYASSNEAADFVKDLANRVIAIIKIQNIEEPAKEAKLDDIFLNAVDTKWIARFSMGRYWRTINPAQQEQFLNLFSRYLTSIYVPNFRKYTGNIVQVLGATQVGDRDYLVHTRLTDELKTMDLKIDYRVMQDETGVEKFVIFDIIAEGVSLITTQRAEVGSVMSGDGFDALVNLLNQKTAK